MKRLKTLIALLVFVMTLQGVQVSVLASTGNVSYTGGAERFVFGPGYGSSLTDLFPEFKEVMPGDTLKQKIVIRNDGISGRDINLYMRSLGSHPEAEKFLSEMTLTVKHLAKSKSITSSAGESGKLTGWFPLGTLHPGDQVFLEVVLSVPITMGNEFQDSIGYIDWQFKAEELNEPEEGGGLGGPGATDPKTDMDNGSYTETDTPLLNSDPPLPDTFEMMPNHMFDLIPQTGDESPIRLNLVLFFWGLLGVFGYLYDITRRK